MRLADKNEQEKKTCTGSETSVEEMDAHSHRYAWLLCITGKRESCAGSEPPLYNKKEKKGKEEAAQPVSPLSTL